jgi:hypothetical protein
MDRERRLLYAVSAVALVSEVLTLFVLYHRHDPDLPSRAAALEEVRDCKERLNRCYGAYFARHACYPEQRDPQTGPSPKINPITLTLF